MGRLSPPPSRDRRLERPGPEPVEPPGPEAWPRRPTERPTGRPERETRLELPALAPPPWSSEEDLVVASPSSKILWFCYLHVTLIQKNKVVNLKKKKKKKKILKPKKKKKKKKKK